MCATLALIEKRFRFRAIALVYNEDSCLIQAEITRPQDVK